MKLAISNIAWDTFDDPKVLGELKNHGIQGIEIAPTKIWPDWLGASESSARRIRSRFQDEGFELPAMQAVLFGKPRLNLFDPASHQNFIEHFKLIADLAKGLGSSVIVLGAPKNRKRGQLSMQAAMQIALEFIPHLAEVCHNRGVAIGLEHNPVEYGCDFITNAADAMDLVHKVGHPGLKLHLDSAGLHLCGGSIAETIHQADGFVHFHISEPMLMPLTHPQVDHSQAAQALREVKYNRWVSIEMKTPATFQELSRSLAFAQNLYGDKHKAHRNQHESQ